MKSKQHHINVDLISEWQCSNTDLTSCVHVDKDSDEMVETLPLNLKLEQYLMSSSNLTKKNI